VNENLAAGVSQWATKSGSVWARRWRDTDAGLAGLSPYLLSAVKAAAPEGPFRAFDIGCGPGTTTLDVAAACPQSEIVACDVSSDLVEIARQRSSDNSRIRVVEGDAEERAGSEEPFDLFFSRHGVMFFDDPVRAFRSFRNAASPGASMVFSCFRSWGLNPWASELAAAAAGRDLPPPGREPSGFAFADPDYVRDILGTSGWAEAAPIDVTFDYVAGEGADAVDSALSFFSELGPSSRLLEALPENERGAAQERMRSVIERHQDAGKVTFQAAAWIWAAKASSNH
jgi:SAM-dependent methyltransferase